MGELFFVFVLAITIIGCNSVQEKPVEAEISGKITEINKESNQILIMNDRKKNENTSSPELIWVGLSEKGELFVDGAAVPNIFEQSLVGHEAKVWTTGFIAESKPPQVFALKIIVE